MSRPRLVTTGELADALGLHMRTIQRYRHDGLITPTIVTRGGHARWDIDQVVEQLREKREEPE
jgi:DNA-binding transcriptional MerR regulator